MSRARRFVVVVGTAALLAAPGTAELGDPTRPPGSLRAPLPAGPLPDHVLSSVIVTPTDRIAVIDGRQVREGDRIAGATVDEIALHRVHLRRGDQWVVLTLSGGVEPPPPPAGLDPAPDRSQP